ncbi:MAG: glutaredoxin family protein [Patescibacteria group bacterium]
MNSKNILIAIIVILVLLGGAWYLSASSQNKDNERIILFYGDTCPHCEKVEEFVKANKVDDKVKFERLEVYNNQTNANLLGQMAKICKIPTEQGVGVPFLWNKGKCLVGDQEIIGFFQGELDK